jgi:hypothetical protein
VFTLYSFLQLVGQSVSQLFRKEVYIAELPRLDPPRRYKAPSVFETESGLDLCTLFKNGESVI